jgi:hypothetical protein
MSTTKTNRAPLRIRASLADLPKSWHALLQWGPCFCPALDGQTCPSCVHAEHIIAQGLDWEAEYERATKAGDAIQL